MSNLSKKQNSSGHWHHSIFSMEFFKKTTCCFSVCRIVVVFLLFFPLQKTSIFPIGKLGVFHLDRSKARLAWPISWSIHSPVRWRWGWAKHKPTEPGKCEKRCIYIYISTWKNEHILWKFVVLFRCFFSENRPFSGICRFFKMGYPILLDWLVNRDSHKGRFHHHYKPRAVWPIWQTSRLWGVFCCWTWIERRRFCTSWYRNQPGSERGVIVKRELSIESEILWDGTVYLRDHRSYIHCCLRCWILNLWQLGGGCETTLPKGGRRTLQPTIPWVSSFQRQDSSSFWDRGCQCQRFQHHLPWWRLGCQRSGRCFLDFINRWWWLNGGRLPSFRFTLYILGKKTHGFFFRYGDHIIPWISVLSHFCINCTNSSGYQDQNHIKSWYGVQIIHQLRW